MTAPVTHINLLARTSPVRVVALALAGVLAATLAGAGWYGTTLWSRARAAEAQRDALVSQITQIQGRLAAIGRAQASSARSIALRSEIEALQVDAKAAQELLSVVRADEGGRAEDFSNALGAVSRVKEPGLWLTGLQLTSGGRRVELQGQARDGPSVLRYARNTNQSLQPLAVHLDSLEVQGGAGKDAAGGSLTFRAY